MNGTKTEWAPGRWRLRVYVGRDPATGRPRQASRQFAGSKKEADAALRRFVAEVEQGRVRSTHPTVKDVLDEWMAHRTATPLTLAGDRGYIDRRIVPVLGQVRLDRLTARHLDQAYRAWLDEGLAPATVRKLHAIISAALHQAMKWEWTDRAVSQLASPPRPDGHLVRSISPDELVRLIRAARDVRPVLAVAVSLGAVTGARRGELCALRWSDLDAESGTLTIGRSLSVLAGGRTVMGGTKTHQVRRILLDEGTLLLLGWWRDQQAELAEWAGVGLCRDPYVLTVEPRGHLPVLPGTLSHWFTALARSVGLPYHFHELRHFAATQMIAGGIDPRMAATRLGHARPSVTLQIYAHAVQAADRRAAELLGRTLPELP
jgi:integrase